MIQCVHLSNLVYGGGEEKDINLAGAKSVEK